MKRSAAALALAMGLTGVGNAPAGPAAKGDLAKAQDIVAKVCVGCHGMDGNGTEPTNPEFPRLAGIQAEYLAKQMREFQSGKRKSDVMAAIAASLSPDDILNLSAYFAAQPRKPNAVKNPGMLEAGKKFYHDGNPDEGVPACAGCHLPDARGTDRYPHLAGQHAAYVYQQLKKFGSSERENDRGLVMQSVAMRMTDEQMKAVAEYIASLK